MKPLLENDIFTAAVALTGIGITSIAVYKMFCYSFGKYGVGITITSNDRSVPYFYRWLAAQNALENANYIGVKLQNKNIEENKSEDAERNSLAFLERHQSKENEHVDDTKLVSIPEVGVTFLKLKGKTVRLEKTEYIVNDGTVVEIIHLSAFGVERKFLEDMIEQARYMCETRPKNKVTIYQALHVEWMPIGSRNRRKIESVVLDKGIAESLLADIKEFVESKQWYNERGVPHRRGYLLYGPPGCGKTSLISAIASEMNYAICVLNLKSRGMSDDVLTVLMNSVPDKALVLLEDVDSVFTSRETNDNSEEKKKSKTAGEMFGMEEPGNKVTFSGLLNAIDGVTLSEGRILFMTTNHIEKLDPALIRPGRVDRRQLINYPNTKQAKRLFRLFYPQTTESQIEEFGKRFAPEDGKRSVAEIQSLFMLYKNDTQSVIENLFKENVSSVANDNSL